MTAAPAGTRQVPEDDAHTPLLSVRDLCVAFSVEDHGYVRVVDGVDLDVRPHETLGLVGESGSGKTVTSLAIMGLVRAPRARVSGSVRFDGRELLGASARELGTIRGSALAMIFQEPSSRLNPSLTVGEQIAEVVRRHTGAGRRAARARSIEMLDRVEIPNARERADAYPHQLSGGMCQRVMIAMALSCEPKLLIADEPTTALDATIQAQVLDLLRRMQQELGTALVFVTHDLGIVADICDRVAVMYAGQVVESTDVHSLFARPRHPYADGLLRSMPQAHARGERLNAIPGVVPMPHALPAGCRFHARCRFRVEDRCTSEPIPLREVDPGQVRCVRADELSLRGTP